MVITTLKTLRQQNTPELQLVQTHLLKKPDRELLIHNYLIRNSISTSPREQYMLSNWTLFNAANIRDFITTRSLAYFGMHWGKFVFHLEWEISALVKVLTTLGHGKVWHSGMFRRPMGGSLEPHKFSASKQDNLV